MNREQRGVTGCSEGLHRELVSSTGTYTASLQSVTVTEIKSCGFTGTAARFCRYQSDMMCLVLQFCSSMLQFRHPDVRRPPMSE